MNKKYRQIRDEIAINLEESRAEFSRLEKAFRAYEKAMLDRLKSAELNGDWIGNHCAGVGNSHQSEIDQLRRAGERFALKVCGVVSADAVFSAMGEAYNEQIDKAENEALA